MSKPAIHQETKTRDGRTVAAWRGVLSGFCASLVGIGLARFAYTPLLPAIVDARWFDPSKAAYLGAANLAGYLAGALAGGFLAGRVSTPTVLRSAMVLATLAFFACAHPASFLWFFAWRLLAGFSGGTLMVLAAPLVLPGISPARRGVASGAIFMGVGAGVVASGTMVPWLLGGSLSGAWIGLGLLSLLLTAIAWRGWPSDALTPAPSAEPCHRAPPARLLLWPLYIEYALNAAGWVPHMIFLVDFVARGLGQGLRAGAGYWVLFGAGATAGPVLAGMLADRIGFGRALRFAFALEIFGVAAPALDVDAFWLAASSVVVGAFVTGTVPLLLGRVQELLAHRPAQQNSAWRTATVGFALSQAAAAYGLSFVFSRSGGDYRWLFFIGAVAMAMALALDIAVSARQANSAVAGSTVRFR